MRKPFNFEPTRCQTIVYCRSVRTGHKFYRLAKIHRYEQSTLFWIKSFKKLLCDESNRDLQEHSVWLNNVQVLEPHIKLSELCIEQNGTVQINAQVCNQRINIVDIWKIPADSMHISEVQGTTTSLNMPNKFGHNIRLW